MKQQAGVRPTVPTHKPRSQPMESSTPQQQSATPNTPTRSLRQRRMQLPPPHLTLILATTLLALCLLGCSVKGVLAYDPLDPSGNVTIVWDVVELSSTSTYTVNVSVVNHQKLRKVEDWHVQWTWPGNEFIADARGAEATGAGNCKDIILKNKTKPHSCDKNPVFVDLALTDKPPVPGCCRGGLLKSPLLRTNESISVFEIDVANTVLLPKDLVPAPINLRLINAPGYKCSLPFIVPEMLHLKSGSRRAVPSMQTWNVVCSFRRSVQAPPKCCVSFSAFYSPDVVPCPACSCACGAFSRKSSLCLLQEVPETTALFLGDAQGTQGAYHQPNSIICSPDGCPVHIRFHLKANYREQWRAKLTVFNRQFQMSQEGWQLVLQHPDMGSVLEVLSFNSTFLAPFGVNNTAVLSGHEGYNDWVLRASNATGPGFVQTEMLMQKDNATFSLANGWPFPRKVVFNGQECAMPSEFPLIPESFLPSISGMFV